MYTSDTEIKDTRIVKNALLTAFILLFGIIYEIFGHGVISYSMILAFLFPLFGLLIPSIVIKKTGKYGIYYRYSSAISAYKALIATLTVGSIINGVLEIYGTTNRLTIFYPAASIILAIITVILLFVKKR